MRQAHVGDICPCVAKCGQLPVQHSKHLGGTPGHYSSHDRQHTHERRWVQFSQCDKHIRWTHTLKHVAVSSLPTSTHALQVSPIFVRLTRQRSQDTDNQAQEHTCCCWSNTRLSSRKSPCTTAATAGEPSSGGTLAPSQDINCSTCSSIRMRRKETMTAW